MSLELWDLHHPESADTSGVRGAVACHEFGRVQAAARKAAYGHTDPGRALGLKARMWGHPAGSGPLPALEHAIVVLMRGC